MLSIRVLHIHRGLAAGGVESWLARLPRFLPGDIELYYYLMVERGEFADAVEAMGVRLLSPKRPPPGWLPENLAYPPLLARAIREVRPDVIHVHTEGPLPAAVFGKALAGSRAPVIAHRHNRPYVRRGTLLWRLQLVALRRTEVLLCCSERVRQAHIEFYGFPADRARLHYLGIPLEPFERLPDRQQAREELGVGTSEDVLVFVGRIAREHKGLDTLVEACGLLARRGRDVTVLLVGPGDDLAAMKSQAEGLGVHDRIRFLGFRQHPEVLVPLRAADVFVHPSRWEGLPLSIVEAQAAGLPVVATTVGGIPEVVEDGTSGILVRPEAPEALADAIQWMLDHPEERRRMGEAGRRLVHERFDMRVTTAQIADIYRELAVAAG